MHHGKSKFLSQHISMTCIQCIQSYRFSDDRRTEKTMKLSYICTFRYYKIVYKAYIVYSIYRQIHLRLLKYELFY